MFMIHSLNNRWIWSFISTWFWSNLMQRVWIWAPKRSNLTAKGRNSNSLRSLIKRLNSKDTAGVVHNLKIHSWMCICMHICTSMHGIMGWYVYWLESCVCVDVHRGLFCVIWAKRTLLNIFLKFHYLNWLISVNFTLRGYHHGEIHLSRSDISLINT